MKITETTTLAELQKYLKVCGDPFITLMSGHLHGPHARHAIIHVPELGTFHGGGGTVAEALEAAFTGYRRATLPEPLKPYTDTPRNPAVCRWCGERSCVSFDAENECSLRMRQVPRKPYSGPILAPCHGCGSAPADHPNESGCQHWHDKP